MTTKDSINDEIRDRFKESIKAEIENRFTFHPATDDQAVKYETLRALGKEMCLEIVALCPESQESHMALILIDQAIMAANAAVARGRS